MCSPQKDFLLCTCVGDMPEDNYWRLTHQNSNQSAESQLVSHGGIKSDEPNEPLIQLNIKEHLNQRDCFDFSYVPRDSDMLQLCLNGSEYFFVFNGTTSSWEIFYPDQKNPGSSTSIKIGVFALPKSKDDWKDFSL